MIRYALVCEHDHGFEAWFGSSGDYDDQAGRGLVECPLCASTAVRKQIMAPAVAGARGEAADNVEARARIQAMMQDVAGQVRRHVEESFDYVGDRFAREARDIHEGRSEVRGIYGEATPQEVKSLAADGVPVAPLPPAPRPKGELN